MNEPGVFPWGKVISYLLWILGVAVILADISFHDFLVCKKKVKWKEVLWSDSFIRTIHLAGILIVFGLSGAVQSPLLGGIFAAVGFLLILFFVKEKKFLRMFRKWIQRW